MRLSTRTSPESALHTNPTCGGLPGPTTHVDRCPTATRPSSDTSSTALVLYTSSRPFSGRIVKPLRRVHTKGFRLQAGSEHEAQLNRCASAPPAALPYESTELRLTTLRPFGGTNISGLPFAPQRIRATRPLPRTA